MTSRTKSADPALFRQQVRAQLLRNGATGSGLGVVGLLLGAAGVLVVGVVVSGFVFTVWQSLIGPPSIGWWGIFFLYLLLLVPLLFWTAARQDFDLASRLDADTPASYGEYQLNRLQNVSAWITELFLWGPRNILVGYRGLAVPHGSRCDVGTDIVLYLYDKGTAAPASALRTLADSPAAVQDALGWLDRQGCIGQSTNGDRVWLSSDMRSKLLKLRTQPGLQK